MIDLLEYLKGVKVVNKANAIMVTRDIGSYQEYTLYVNKENAERLIKDTKDLLFKHSSTNIDVSDLIKAYSDKLGHTPNDYDRAYVKIKLFKDNWYFDVIGDWKIEKELDDRDLYNVQRFSRISWKGFKEYAKNSDIIKNPIHV